MVLVFLSLTSCKSDKEKKEDYVFNFSEISLFSQGTDGVSSFSIKGNAVKKIGILDGVTEFNYQIKNSIYVFLKNIAGEKSLQKNEIIIFKGDKQEKLNDFYTATDIKMSSSGERIAFRNFKDGDIKSVQPLKVYNIKKEKYDKFHTNVLISGDLYQWLDDDTLAYYGSNDGTHDRICVYDFNSSSEKTIMGGIKGYITFFEIIKDKGILFLQEDGESTKLCYLDLVSGKKNVLTSQISDISNALISSKGNIFFTGYSTEENEDLLYEFNNSDGGLKRINYDFPKKVDKSSGIAEFDQKVYFCGIDDSNVTSLYMYNDDNDTVNYISPQKGKLIEQGQ